MSPEIDIFSDSWIYPISMAKNLEWLLTNKKGKEMKMFAKSSFNYCIGNCGNNEEWIRKNKN